MADSVSSGVGEGPRPRLLDLFCKQGGASEGYRRAGFEVFGVDIEGQPNYPFDFIQADAIEMLTDAFETYTAPGWFWTFDAIHASPPCPRYSVLRHANVTKGSDHPDLVDRTRELLQKTGLPWVMENVPGAPMTPAIVLCGSMFGLGSGERQLRRHRLFESNLLLMQPQCQHKGEAIGVYGGGPTGRYTFENGIKKGLKGRRGGYQGRMDERREAMGIDWMTSDGLNNALPPAYTEFIGTQLLQHIKSKEVL